MKATEIARVPAAQDIKRLSEETLAKAKALLGYNANAVRVYGQLAGLLKQAGIEPLNRRQVEAYKASKARQTLTNETKYWTIWFSGWSVWGTAIAFFHSTLHWELTAAASALLFVVGSVISRTVWKEKGSTRQVPQWVTEHIGAFDGYIPEFALEKAIALKEMAQNMTVLFSVEYLRTMEEQVAWPDPFLLVKFGKETYYLDVWDEPEFERATRI